MSALPTKMTAIEISGVGGPEVLKPVERPLLPPGAGEVVIEVAAAGLNRGDVMQRQGTYPPPAGASDIPGLEVSGRIAAVGPDVTRFKVGDEVCALVTGGGYASHCVAWAAHTLPVPKGVSLVDAAALPETAFTVWTNVFERGRLQVGESILIHGGSSGIGTTAIQLAHHLGARQVFATAGSDEKCRVCEELGATRAINYRDQDFVEVVQKESGGRGVDVILDMVGGDYLPKNVGLLTLEGRLVYISFLNGSKVTLDFMAMMAKRATITGSTLRPRTVEQKAALAGVVYRQVWPLIEQGKVKPVIAAKFPYKEAPKAHALMESGKYIGKILLTM